MKKQTFTILIIILISLWLSACKSVIVKPNNFSFNGITLYPNNTYDLVYAEHDVSGVSLNFGKYYYVGDTLVLILDKQNYLDKLTKPTSSKCQEEVVTLNFKEYLSPYNPTSSMSTYWFGLSIMGISKSNDTLNLWSTNTLGKETDLNQITLTRDKVNNINKLWVEIFNTPTTDPIFLPNEFGCVNITIPIINVIWAHVSNKHVMWGMDKFIVRESKNMYKIEAITRNKKYKIKKK